MSTFARLLACIALGCVGASMIVHSPAQHVGTMDVLGTGLFLVGLVGLIDIALGET